MGAASTTTTMMVMVMAMVMAMAAAMGSATREELAQQFGVSTSTLDRVNTILDQGTPEQIQALRDKNETGEGPGVCAVYDQVQQEKLKKDKLQTDKPAQEVRRDNLKLLKRLSLGYKPGNTRLISRPCSCFGLPRAPHPRRRRWSGIRTTDGKL
jgi:hypothetical protein